jgi:ankyrin repeat protein
MAPPSPPLEILEMIPHHHTDDDGELCLADFNSFVKINRVLYSSLNRELWKKAVESKSTTARVFTQLIRTNNLTLLGSFLKLGADTETLLPQLHSVADRGSLSKLRNLDPTPLKVAAALNNVAMARLLLKHSADVVQSDKRGLPSDSSIHAAFTAEMVQLLMDYGADPEQHSFHDYTALHYYVTRHNTEALRVALGRGARPDPTPGRLSYTPLHAAAEECNIDAVKLLLEYGADESEIQFCLVYAVALRR